VLKLNSSGTYQWNTFYGSSGSDYSHAITVTSSGFVYVTGYSSATWNGDAGPQHSHSGGDDIFILELDHSGAYQWHTFYGPTGSGSVQITGIVVDSSGNVYVAGDSFATWNGETSGPKHSYTGNYDIFVLKLISSICQINSRSVHIENTSLYYSDIQTAYNAASTDQTVLMQAKNFPGNLVFTDDIFVTLKGGYSECDYSLATGQTSVTGEITIGGIGHVIIDNLIVK
jgi:hypothetical protein